MILEELHISLIGKNIIILNRSPRIGLPLLNYFLKQNVDVGGKILIVSLSIPIINALIETILKVLP